MKLFENLTMFEQRILCRKLPKSFSFIQAEIDQEQCVNKRNKIIQELKRRMLNIELEQYEMKIQHYEHLYQQDFHTLQLQILNPTSSDHKCQVNILVHCVNLYLHHYTNRVIRQIRYKESRLHVKLIHHYRRHSVSKKKIIDVYPQIIVDASKVSLNQTQLDYLSHNGKLTIILFSSILYPIYLLWYLLFLFIIKDLIILDQIRVIFILINIDKNK